MVPKKTEIVLYFHYEDKEDGIDFFKATFSELTDKEAEAEKTVWTQKNGVRGVEGVVEVDLQIKSFPSDSFED